MRGGDRRTLIQRLRRGWGLLLVVSAIGAGCSLAGGSAEPTMSSGCELDPRSRATTVMGANHAHGGTDRRFNLTVPPGAPAGPSPLVINLHGGLTDASFQDTDTRLAERAAAADFAVLTPEVASGVPTWTLGPDSDDAAHVLDLLDRIEATQCIDLTRVHLTGFSMGAMLALDLACREPGRFASVAPVAGTISLAGCPAGSVPLLAIHGRDDPVVGFDGSRSAGVAARIGSDRGDPVPDVVDTWARHHGCDEEPLILELAAKVVETRYRCDATRVRLIVVEGGTHAWPGGASASGPDLDLDATAMILGFFARDSD